MHSSWNPVGGGYLGFWQNSFHGLLGVVSKVGGGGGKGVGPSFLDFCVLLHFYVTIFGTLTLPFPCVHL